MAFWQPGPRFAPRAERGESRHKYREGGHGGQESLQSTNLIYSPDLESSWPRRTDRLDPKGSHLLPGCVLDSVAAYGLRTQQIAARCQAREPVNHAREGGQRPPASSLGLTHAVSLLQGSLVELGLLEAEAS